MTKKRAALKSLMSIFLMILTAMMINTTEARAEEEFTCPNTGENWNNGGTKNVIRYGNSNCYLIFKYCWRMSGNVLVVYLAEIAKTGGCFDSLDLLTDYEKYVKIICDSLAFSPKFGHNLVTYNCALGANAVVRIGHPQCLTRKYTQEIVVTYPQPDKPDEWLPDGSWGIALPLPSANAVSVNPASGSNLNSTTQTNSPNSSSQANTAMALPAYGREFVHIVSNCGTVYADDICWAVREYCWVWENEKKVIKKTDRPITTVMGSGCPEPAGRYVYTYEVREAGGPSFQWGSKWVNCNFMCNNEDE